MSLLNKIRDRIPYLRKPLRRGKFAEYDEKYNLYIRRRDKQSGLNIKDYYKLMSNTWVNACISVKTNEILNLGWNIRNTNTNLEEMSSEDIYIQNLFKRPMGYNSNMTFEKLISLVCTSHMALGDAFVECITDDDGLLIGFQHVPVEYLKYDYDTDRFCFRNQQGIQYDDNELIHIYNPPIDGGVWGVSPIDILLDDLLLEGVSRNHTKDILTHGGLNPSNAIEYDADMDDDEYLEEFERLQNQAKDRRKKNSTLILKGGTYKSMGFSPKDMEYQELQKDIRDRILAIYQVPPSKVDVFETANLGSGRDTAQAENFKKVLFSETNLICGEFNRILNEYGFECELSFNELDIENKEERATIENMQLQSGVRTINEIREGYGLEPVEWGDTPMISGDVADVTDVTGKGLVSQAEKDLIANYPYMDYYGDSS